MTILPPERCGNWLQDSAKVSGDFLRALLTEPMDAGKILNR